MNNGTSRCDPIDGYYESGVTQATQCVSPCLTCSSSSSCNSCVDGFYLSGISCLPCSTICPTCNSSTICTSCDIGYELNLTDDTCNSICGDGMWLGQ